MKLKNKKNIFKNALLMLIGFIIIVFLILLIISLVKKSGFTDEELVIPAMVGGLGNQLFFVAHAYIYGKKHNKTLKMKKQDSYYSIGKPRPAYFDSLFHSIPLIDEVPEKITKIDEHEIPKDNHIDGHVLISGGYFQLQNEILKPYLPELSNLFTNPKMQPTIDEIINTNDIDVENDWLLHVRLPDDWTPADSTNVTLPQDFEKIKEYLSTLKDNNSKIIIFSNDIPKTREYLGLKDDDAKYKFMDYNEIESIYVISRMHKFIPSTSTFNTWGVLLSIGNGNPVKIKLLWDPSVNQYRKEVHDLYMVFKEYLI